MERVSHLAGSSCGRSRSLQPPCRRIALRQPRLRQRLAQDKKKERSSARCRPRDSTPFDRRESPRECVLIKRTVRGGQVETHDGDVVIIGDVNRDSIVSASGDVAVFGRLSGEVYAGNRGDVNATVTAICFEPSQM